jgi:hypothetical protein
MDTQTTVNRFVDAQKAQNNYISVARYPERYVVMYYIANKKATKVFYMKG